MPEQTVTFTMDQIKLLFALIGEIPTKFGEPLSANIRQMMAANMQPKPNEPPAPVAAAIARQQRRKK
jgi:hypothetical protein